MKKIRHCERCTAYTLKGRCDKCGTETIINAPIKYYKDENIAKYRREIKGRMLKERGFL
jgi:rRNA maturation protein Nop10